MAAANIVSLFAAVVAGFVTAAGDKADSCVELRTDYASCTIDTTGARVISFKVRGEEVLWNANPVQTRHAEWAHGGMPVCWPWFSRKPNDSIHGFAWRRRFNIVSRTDGLSRSELVLHLADGGLELTCRFALTDELNVEMVTDNRSSDPMDFSMGFHPYFKIGERDRTRICGLTPVPLVIGKSDGAVPCGKSPCTIARIVDPVLDRTLIVAMDNATGINVWNPGTVVDDVPGELPPDAWRNFVAVEPVCGKFRQPVRIAPGELRNLRISVALRRGAKTAGYEGADPRYPDFPEKSFSLPFKAMFIGAHPDDAEYDFGCAAAKLVKAGAKVTFVSVCNGDNGHQMMKPAELAARRYRETQASARAYGIDRYVVMGEHDCIVEPTVELRQRVTRFIRDLAPNMVVCHRTCDYHADHRAAGQVVQDSTYLLGVPSFAPESPIPETLPFVVYAGDPFTMPRPFRPDLVVDGQDVFDLVCRCLACHESQLFEWLPPEYGIDPAGLDANSPKRAKVVAMMAADMYADCDQHRELVERLFGPGRRPVNVFEVCEYSRPPCRKEIDYLKSIDGFKWVGKWATDSRGKTK